MPLQEKNLIIDTSRFLSSTPLRNHHQVCDRENYEFTRRVFERSGIGRVGSYLPRELALFFIFLFH